MAGTPTASGRTRLSSAESRQAILDAADSLLRSGPYRDLSVETVMAKAGLSRTIFYRHFNDLPALVTELLQQLGNGIDTHAVEAAKSIAVEPTSEWVREILRPSVDFFADHGAMFRGVADAVGADDRLREAYESIMRYFTSVTADGLGRLRDSGRLSGVDVESVSAALNAMNERYMLRTLGSEPQEDRERVLDTLVVIWSRTLELT